MKTFAPNKNAEELKIDLSRKFVVVEGDAEFKKGEILTLKNDDNTVIVSFWNEDKSVWHYMCWHQLAYAEEVKSWDNLEVGDILIDQNGEERAVLGISGEDVFFSYEDDHSKVLGYGTKTILQSWGWTIRGVEAESWTVKSVKWNEEMTLKEVCKELGREIKIKK